MRPYQFCIQNRIRKAHSILDAERVISGVAAEMGFYDQSYFGKAFQKIVEITPGEWQIMEVLWACGEPLTSSEVYKRRQENVDMSMRIWRWQWSGQNTGSLAPWELCFWQQWGRDITRT